MSRRYATDHKQLVMRLVKEAFNGDVAKTARYANIPERTLRDWLHAEYMRALYQQRLARSLSLNKRKTTTRQP
ncbi:MAG: hypothetical protein R3E39_28870 [Anaerolineae bacterium]